MKIFKKLVVTLVVTFGFIYMGYILVNQQIELNKLNNQIADITRDIHEKQLETEKLNDTLDSLSDNEYLEEVARKRLGLVKPTEIIFMDASI